MNRIIAAYVILCLSVITVGFTIYEVIQIYKYREQMRRDYEPTRQWLIKQEAFNSEMGKCIDADPIADHVSICMRKKGY